MSRQAEKIPVAAPARASSSHGVLQRKCACGNHAATSPCAECTDSTRKLQRHASHANEAGSVPPIVHDVLRSSGRPLDSATRAYMEPRFGHDFSRVRVHDDARAAESARAVSARAYATGHNIVLDGPSAGQDRELIAHELAHVVQQRAVVSPQMPQFFGGDARDPAEMEADGVARRIAGGASAGLVSAQPASTVARKLKVIKPKALIPNPGGKGLVQTNAQTVESYLQTLCSGGSCTVNAASGEVALAAGYCTVPSPAVPSSPASDAGVPAPASDAGAPMPASDAGVPGSAAPPAQSPAASSKEATGCTCLCDMVGSSRQWSVLVDDKSWPHTDIPSRTVTTPSPNSELLWGAATVSGKTTNIDPWLVLGHELCGHAWLKLKGLPDHAANRGEGGHQETVARENLLRGEHGIEERGSFKDPYCGESFSQTKAGPGRIEWSSYLKICEAWRKKKYGSKYKISDKIP